MAKINGVELKAVGGFEGMEGHCSYGNIYVCGKKIGSWSEESHGGDDDFSLERSYSLERFFEMIAKVRPLKEGKRFGDKETDSRLSAECLMRDLLDLKDEETAFKKAKKDGYDTIFTITDGYHWFAWCLPGTDWTEEKFAAEYAKELEEAEENLFKNKEHVRKLYTDISQFTIGLGNEIRLEDIKG